MPLSRTSLFKMHIFSPRPGRAVSLVRLLSAVLSLLCWRRTQAFHQHTPHARIGIHRPSFRPTLARHTKSFKKLSSHDDETPLVMEPIVASNMWESLALQLVGNNLEENPSQIRDFVQYVTLLRVGIPSLGLSVLAHFVYPPAALWVASMVEDSGVFAVLAFDLSQYIQNILTTSGLVFALLVGNTFVFLYQQQEAIYLALFEEVTMAKSLLEQVALVSQGRESLYQRILACMHAYVHEDLTKFEDPAVMISKRPDEDPLEDILFLTSVGEPSIVYQTVRSLRKARANRLGALQEKLPNLHMALLWVLFAIVLFTFPLLGAGSQTIGGPQILAIQAWYLSFIVFAMSLTMGVIHELRRPGERGAYNAMIVLCTMAKGLVDEIDMRMDGTLGMTAMMEMGPSVDGDGSFDETMLN